MKLLLGFLFASRRTSSLRMIKTFNKAVPQVLLFKYHKLRKSWKKALFLRETWNADFIFCELWKEQFIFHENASSLPPCPLLPPSGESHALQLTWKGFKSFRKCIRQLSEEFHTLHLTWTGFKPFRKCVHQLGGEFHTFHLTWTHLTWMGFKPIRKCIRQLHDWSGFTRST